ncbi:MAG TPA: antitoxin Xre/MbcA/ParS toxin-binding domain-containing protein [Chitinophagaceae bacterium]|nr:antitoxin Xre/MbcA/ParS toxin-binding domain-containing protein [Chitinophagaceae bacterium]
MQTPKKSVNQHNAKKYTANQVETAASVVNDSGMAYSGAMPGHYLSAVAQNIAGKVRALKDMLQGNTRQVSNITPYEKIEMINKGISKTDLEYLKQKSGLGYDQLSEVLDVARATLINKKGSDKFNQSLSEKIVSLADIYSYGYEVFEDEERFNAWVFRPNQALGGKAPYSFLTNQYGREEVKNLIGRIDYGVYA